MIKTRELSVSFGEKHVLSGITLAVAQNERLALQGPSGVGKTTLLRVLAALRRPTRGDAWICDHSVSGNQRSLRGLVGWAPSGEGGFVSHLTGRENLLFFGALGGWTPAEIEEHCRSWCDLAPLRECLVTPFAQASTGMRQTLSLCRAFLGNSTQVLLLDEPTRGLDPAADLCARQLMMAGAVGRSLIFSTHSEDEARSLGTRQVRLLEGRLHEMV